MHRPLDKDRLTEGRCNGIAPTLVNCIKTTLWNGFPGGFVIGMTEGQGLFELHGFHV